MTHAYFATHKGTDRLVGRVLRSLGAVAVGAVGLAGNTQPAGAAPGDNSVCAQWCHDHFSGAAAG